MAEGNEKSDESPQTTQSTAADDIVVDNAEPKTVESAEIKPTNEVHAVNNEKSNEKDIAEITSLKDVAEAEGQQKKLPYPKSVFFIISNEFCERFNYYGMRTILVLYLSQNLMYSDDTATVIYHVFTMFVYFLCVFGAIISDSWLGKFKTILYLSLVYVCGSILVALGAIPPLNLPGTTFTMIGLALIALGSGGIKPCVSAFGGDQFKLPEQIKVMTSFFSLFYFSINAGSLISTLITPILREDVHCFGEKECYSLAFGVPAILMALSIVIFVLGRPLYKTKPPAGNMVVLVSKTIGNAIATKWKEKKTNPREHWLDYADKKYDRSLIEDVKVLMRVLVLYLPLPVFWALFDQQGSRWTFQATRMDGDMGSWDIKPDQVQLLNPLLILVLIPLYDVAFYPALRLVGISRPLQKLTMGGILAGIAFVISALIELKLEPTYPVLPSSNLAQLRIFNGENCNLNFETNIPNFQSFEVENRTMFVNKEVPIENGNFLLSIAVTGCYNHERQVLNLTDKTAYSIFINSQNTTHPFAWIEDDFVNKPSRGRPLGRTLINTAQDRKVTWRNSKDSIEHEEPAGLRNLTEFKSGDYSIWIDETKVTTLKLHTGGVYSVIITEEAPNSYLSAVTEVTDPNSVSILWLIPQYVVMTLGEVMFSVTGLEFSYSQAPLTMKSVLQACWLLTVAFGNVIVVIIAELSLFDSQASEFFLFAGLMFVDMIVFTFMAYRYKPNNPMENSEMDALLNGNGKHEIPALEGLENKSADLKE